MNNRREFIKRTLGGSAIISMSGMVPNVLLGASRQTAKKRGDKILVVVQLSGGNDGLNTVVPYGDDLYYKNRFTLAIDEAQLHKVDSHIGLHPALDGFNDLLQDGRLSIVQGVGYPNPNRSHFESMDLWHTAHQLTGVQTGMMMSAGASAKTTGWLGRAIDSSLKQDVPAIHFGAEQQPLALKTIKSPVPSIRSIDDFRLRANEDPVLKKTLAQLLKTKRQKNELLSFVHENQNVALATSHRLEKLADSSKPKFGYPLTQLGNNLKAIAQLIGSELETQIYYVTLDGFDTHANQAEAHYGLLNQLGDAVAAFVKELKDQGNDERVALVSFSEFGRRVRENASRGTDHGTAAPLFVVGKDVKKAVVGKHPSLKNLVDGDMRFTTDYRSVYAELLKNWLGLEPGPVIGIQHKPVEIFKA